jgi:subtilase family serine protease
MRSKAAFAAFLAGSLTLCAAGPAARIREPLDNGKTFVLGGHKSPVAAVAHDLGAAPQSLKLARMALHFERTPEQTASLKQLLVQQRDRSSNQYHRWLTPEEFAARFGVNESDLQKVRTWLEAAGFSDVQVSRTRTSISMSGGAANVAEAFGSSIHQYQHHGRQFYAAETDPVLPRGLQGVVGGIRGLNNYGVHSFLSRKPRPQMSIGINGNHFLAPADLATIYNLGPLYSQGTDGTGEAIAVVGQSDIDISDIESFQSAAGLPIKDPSVVLVSEDPGHVSGDEMEADLDLEWTGAVARGANIIYVNSTDALASAEYAIENNVAPVLSISYGLCEAGLAAADMNTYNSVFEEANALGITVVASSGDSGAAACDYIPDANGNPEAIATQGLAVNFPASSPYVTAVGGTEFDDAKGSFWNSNGQATSYIPEIAWNDTPVEKVLSGTGGGVSTQFVKPDWQQGAGVPADGFRDVPDIALSASPVHDPFLICSGGSCSDGFAPPLNKLYFVGGTSCAAPVFAGILAILNQASGNGQGNVNAGLYTLASFGSGVFHDIELGDNRVPCQAGSPNCANGALGYTTGPGYDLVTGLGSLDATQFVEQWGSDFQIAVSPSTLNFKPGSSMTANLQIKRFANYSGPVNLSCSVAGSLTSTTCSVTSQVSGSAEAVLSVSQTPTSALLWPRSSNRTMPASGAAILIAGTGLLVVSKRRKFAQFAAFAALCAAGLTSCGSEDLSSSVSQVVSQTIAGSVVVTASSGVLTHSISVPVTISASN